MKTIVLDSYALLAYFEKEAGWDTVAQLLTDAAADRCALQCGVVNWGEVLYITERVYGADKAEAVEVVMDDLPIEIVDADRALTREAARLKVDGGLAYADGFAAGLALVTDGEVVTGDLEFEDVEGQGCRRYTAECVLAPSDSARHDRRIVVAMRNSEAHCAESTASPPICTTG